jgi:hypothetical protein
LPGGVDVVGNPVYSTANAAQGYIIGSLAAETTTLSREAAIVSKSNNGSRAIDGLGFASLG